MVRDPESGTPRSCNRPRYLVLSIAVRPTATAIGGLGNIFSPLTGQEPANFLGAHVHAVCPTLNPTLRSALPGNLITIYFWTPSRELSSILYRRCGAPGIFFRFGRGLSDEHIYSIPRPRATITATLVPLFPFHPSILTDRILTLSSTPDTTCPPAGG